MNKTLTLVTLTVALTACAGSNNNGKDKPDLGGGSNIGQLNAGEQIFDIDGLGFKTATVNATSIDGQFSYNNGEEITFMLGNTELFTVAGNANISFSDALRQGLALPDTAEAVLAAIDVPPGAAPGDLAPIHEISNKMKLLLVLDNDRDKSNGINLTDWHQKLAETTVDLSESISSNTAFSNTFVDDLAALVAIDLAEPLLYLYSMEGIKVSAARLASTSFDLDSRDTRYIRNFEFHANGDIQRKEYIVHRIDSAADIRKDTTLFAYDQYGFENEILTTKTSDLTSDAPMSEFSKIVREHNGFLTKTGQKIITLDEEWNGENADSASLIFREVSNYTGTLLNGYTANSVDREGNNDNYDYSYEYDSNNRELRQTLHYVGSTGEGVVREDTTNIYSTSYSAIDTDQLKIKTTDYDNDGSIDKSSHVRTRTDASARLVEMEESNFNSEDVLSFHRIVNYAYNDVGLPIQQIELRDSDKDGSVFEVDYLVKTNTYSEDNVLIAQASEFNSNNTVVTRNQYEYTYKQQGLSADRFESIVWTEQRWDWGTAEGDRPEPIRTVTYTYAYDENTGRIDAITFSQIYDGIENTRILKSFGYNSDGNLTEYTTTYNLDDVGGTERTETIAFVYEETDDGLGYLLHNQTRLYLNKFAGSESNAQYDVYFALPSLIGIPTL